ncbi:MAG: hypothetical protein JSU69_04695 [Candidatus Zixiibacteriota bacterium]|nr:MAG: hypothetical protein JSU69_04695 [candidate division Zixibacteria bacterium]
MNPNDLERFFGELLKQEKYIPSASMAVLGKLIRLTIAYRDRWKAEKDEILTVEETRKALDAYQAVLKDGKMPEGLDRKTAGLVKLWLKEINRKPR